MQPTHAQAEDEYLHVGISLLMPGFESRQKRSPKCILVILEHSIELHSPRLSKMYPSAGSLAV